MFSRLIHDVAHTRILFLFMAEGRSPHFLIAGFWTSTRLRLHGNFFKVGDCLTWLGPSSLWCRYRVIGLLFTRRLTWIITSKKEGILRIQERLRPSPFKGKQDTLILGEARVLGWFCIPRGSGDLSLEWMELSSGVPSSMDPSYSLYVCFIVLCTCILSLFDDYISSTATSASYKFILHKAYQGFF